MTIYEYAETVDKRDLDTIETTNEKLYEDFKIASNLIKNDDSLYIEEKIDKVNKLFVDMGLSD